MNGDGICPGACNGHYRRIRALYEAAVAEHARILDTRADTDPVPEPPRAPDIEPWYGLPVWCAKCQGVLRAELAELDDLAAMVGAIPPLARPAEASAGKIAGSREAPSPSARMDDLEEFGEWLRSWEAVARGDEPRPRRGYLATEMTTIAAWLITHFDPLITSPDVAADVGEEIRRWHRDLSRRAAAGRMSRHQKKPCPRCRLYTLWLIIGDDYIRCCNDDCGRAMTREEYDGLQDAA